jgi:ABC-type Fe3+ transport system permease subunit
LAYWSFHWRVSLPVMKWTIGIVAVIALLLCYVAYKAGRNLGNFRV